MARRKNNGARDRCGGTTKRGERCTFTTGLRSTADGWRCIHHDPDRADEARRMRQRGGLVATGNRSKFADPGKVPSRPESLNDVVEWTAWTAVAVATGQIDSKVAREVTNAIRQFQVGLEKRDLEREVRELKRTVNEAKRRTG